MTNAEARETRPSLRSPPSVRVLLFSDLQLDRPYEWAPPAVADARRNACREALVELLSVARSHDVDVVACAGDLFERRSVRPGTMRWLIAALRSASVPVLIAPGNRDFVGPLGGYSEHEWPENVTVFESERFSPWNGGEGVTIWGAAHTEPHRARSFFDGFQVDRDGLNLALFHGAERSGFDRESGTDPCAQFDERDIEANGFNHALVGHYQKAHFGSMHTYPGAPIAHDFGDSGTGGAAVLTLSEDGIVDRRFLEVSSPGVYTVEIDVTGSKSIEDVLRRVASRGERDGMTRLRLVGRLHPDIVLTREELLASIGGNYELSIEWTAEVDIESDQLANEETVRGQFVRDVLAASHLGAERQQHVLLIGLRALAGSDVLEGPR